MTRPRLLLALASVAVAFAAADTYVVVLVLPEMSTSVGVSPEELQRAAPIISGFLLGYVAMLPLIGRIADLRGRLPVLVAALVVFALGSLLTAAAYDMTGMVAGRFLQGLGGGGLVPATLALVADLYPAERRGVPLGVVSAVQEIGSVLGPLFGAAVMAVAHDWRVIFGINLVVGLVLAAAIRTLRFGTKPQRSGPDERRLSPNRSHFDWPSCVLIAVILVAGGLTFLQPGSLMRDLTWGQLFIPATGDSRWLTPIGLVSLGALVLLVLRCLTAARPLVDLRDWGRTLREADVVGAAFLAAALGGVILAFATADPEIEVFSAQGGWYLLGAAIATVAFVLHVRRAPAPVVPRGALRRTPAWGAMVVSFFVGAALVAALIDIPLFARSTIYKDSQLLAALVLVRFLVALPVGAVLGGYLLRRLSAGIVAAAGMGLAAVGFLMLSNWEADALESWTANVPLVLTGLGFGLALAPVNAAMLASTDDDVHGVASAMVVVSRMVGMLVGISALTTIGLRAYYAEQGDLPPVREVCDGRSRCTDYSDLLRAAGVAQEQTVFLGAAFCAAAAAVLAVLLFRGAATRSLPPSDLLRAAG